MAASDDAKVPSTVVSSAVEALIKWKSKAASEKAQLLPEDDFFYLTVTLKKIPEKARVNAYKIPLPHPLYESATSEVCLFVDDRPKSNLTSKSAKKIVEEQGIPVSKVISLSKLKANYKPFDSRRKLCSSYEIFLADKRIVPLLPRLLGHSFFKTKKLPSPVDLTRKDWKKPVMNAMGCAFLFLRTGTCCVIKVGKLSMGKEEVVENVIGAIDGAIKVVPKNWDGIRSFHLRLAGSAALPLYQTLPDLKLKIDGVVENVAVVEAEANEASSAGGEEKKAKKRKRGRIHEVQYMDVGGAGAVELDAEDEKMEEVKNVEVPKLKKKKKGSKKMEEVKNVEEDLEVEKKEKKKGSKKIEEVKIVEDAEEDLEVQKKKKKKGSKKMEEVKIVEDAEDHSDGEDLEVLKKKKKQGAKEGKAASKVTADSGEKKGKRKSKLGADSGEKEKKKSKLGAGSGEKEKKKSKLGAKLEEATTAKRTTRSSTR